MEFNTTMSTVTARVEDMDKSTEELQSEGDMEELRGETQVAVNSVVADFKREIQAL